MDRKQRQMRCNATEFQTREAEDGLFIEGYFSVFNTNYEIWPGATESVAPGAFSSTLGKDIRALVDHETRLVLGRNKSGTLELKEDSHGLWGRVKINYEMQRKGIPSSIRSEALEGIDEQEYRSILLSLLKSKKKVTRGKDDREVYAKLLRFAAGRGFETRETSRCLKQLFNGNDYEDDFE